MNNRPIKELSFAELFENAFYVIPYYQRSYSWDSDNLVNLWEDIEATHRAKDKGVASHFMSSVLIKASESSGGNKTFHIVDGQQRITTMYLALKAAYDLIEASDYRRVTAGVKLSDQLRGLLYGKDYNISDEDMFRVPVTSSSNPRLVLDKQPDDHAFNVLIYKGSSHWNSKHLKSKVAQTYKFFHGKLNTLLTSDSPEKFFYMVSTVLNNFQLIYIPIMEHEAPQKIFESVNGLTKKLFAGELIKNYLLMSLSCEEDSSRIYEKYWAEFDKPEWVETDADKENFTKILYYWVTSRGVKTKSSDEQVYRSFKQVASLNSLSPIEAAEKAEKISGSLYRSITTLTELSNLQQKPRNRLEKSYSRLYSGKNAVNSKSAFILFIELIDELEKHYGDKLNDSQIDKLLSPLESYIIRKVLSSRGYSGAVTEYLVGVINEVFALETIKEYETIEAYIEYSVKAFAQKLLFASEKSKRFETNSEIMETIVGNNVKGIPPKKIDAKDHILIRMMLTQVENHLRTNSFNPSGRDIDGDISVEHWLPQSSNPKDWPLSDEKDRALYTNSLGNLCIIPPRINSSLSNRSLASKIKKVQHILAQDGEEKTGIQTFDKVLELSTQEDSVVSFSWDVSQIEQRAKWIMDIILNKVFMDARHFTGEVEEGILKNNLWANPIEGRRIVAESRKTTVRAYQKADGGYVIDEVLNIQPDYNPSFTWERHIKHRAELLSQAEKQSDGTYHWRGIIEAPNRTVLLSTFVGTPVGDIWKPEE